MNANMKRVLVHSILVIFACLNLAPDAGAELRLKVWVEPFDNPAGETAAKYNPGGLFTEMIKLSLAARKEYHLIGPPLERTSETPAEMGIGTAGKSSFPAQVVIRGKVKSFIVDTQPADKVKGLKKTGRERAEFEAEVTLLNPRTGRVLGRETFHTVSQEGIRPFAFHARRLLQEPEFRMSSLGVAMGLSARRAVAFIDEFFHHFRFGADVISVNEEKRMVTLNAGANDGVRLFEHFRIYSVELDYMDPFTQADLGENWERLGVVKVETVEENFSRAMILAGSGFSMGNTARFQMIPPPPPEEDRKEHHPESKERPWWDFYGILALP